MKHTQVKGKAFSVFKYTFYFEYIIKNEHQKNEHVNKCILKDRTTVQHKCLVQLIHIFIFLKLVVINLFFFPHPNKYVSVRYEN